MTFGCDFGLVVDFCLLSILVSDSLASGDDDEDSDVDSAHLDSNEEPILSRRGQSHAEWSCSGFLVLPLSLG